MDASGGSRGKEPLHGGEAFADVGLLTGFEAVCQVLEEAASAVGDGALAQSGEAAGPVAAEGGVQGGGARIAVQEAEVAGRIDDRGVTPVDLGPAQVSG